MIKINYNLENEDIEEYYSEIIKVRDSRYLLHNKINNIDRFLKKIDNSFSFKDIILADFSRLLEYVFCFEKYIKETLKPKIIKRHKNNEQFIEEYFKKRDDNNYEIKTLIDKDQKEKIVVDINKKICSIFYGIDSILYENKTLNNCISSFFMNYNKEMNIKTCYYCNIDYVNVFEKNTKNHFTLDHILPKSKYPYLSISLFNLIPSCYSCNSKFKGNKEFKNLNFIHKISPSSNTFELETLLKFKLNFDVNDIHFEEKINKVEEIKDVKVVLKNINSESEIDLFLDMFSLNSRYEFHNSISFEMIEKRKKYSDSQITEIVNMFSKKNILIDKETFKKDIYGSILFEKENTNEPFEKYKKDIAKQLGLI